MADQQRIVAAQDAWRAAKQAYDDEANEYVGATLLPAISPPQVKEWTPEAWEKLTRLRDAEKAAAVAFRAVLDES